MSLYGRVPRRPELAAIVERLWYVENPGLDGLEVKLPTGTAQVLINLGGDRLSCAAADADRPSGRSPWPRSGAARRCSTAPNSAAWSVS